MRCLSKKIVKYKEEKRWEEYIKAREEQLSKMSPEERKSYEEECHNKAVDALSNLAMIKNALPSTYNF